MRSAGAKAREWFSRYGLAELFGTAGSYAGFWIVAALAGSLAAASYGAAFGENVGFYGCIMVRELLIRRDRPFRMIVSNMFYEFGTAELLDFFIVRPSATYLAVSMLGDAAGVITGKIAADIVFYALAIGFYERAQARGERE